MGQDIGARALQPPASKLLSEEDDAPGDGRLGCGARFTDEVAAEKDGQRVVAM